MRSKDEAEEVIEGDGEERAREQSKAQKSVQRFTESSERNKHEDAGRACAARPLMNVPATYRSKFLGRVTEGKTSKKLFFTVGTAPTPPRGSCG